MSDLFNTVADIISNISNIDRGKITLDADLMTDLKVDSLDFLDITYEIEKKYGISIPVEEWVEEASTQTQEAQRMFSIKNFLERVQKLIDEKKK